jgi:hypothetical protein
MAYFITSVPQVFNSYPQVLLSYPQVRPYLAILLHSKVLQCLTMYDSIKA